ncbi:MAG: hypothetical protein JSR67_12635 [Proteobacteria bacterium]|nr:hypothetical protein [Pseudomonadota bacterium]
MSRLAELEARRRALLRRCEEQRVDLSQRAAHLHPLFGLLGRPTADAGRGGGHPLAWLTAVAGLLLLGRFGSASRAIRLARSAVSLAARTAFVLRTFGKLRGALSRTRTQ